MLSFARRGSSCHGLEPKSCSTFVRTEEESHCTMHHRLNPYGSLTSISFRQNRDPRLKNKGPHLFRISWHRTQDFSPLPLAFRSTFSVHSHLLIARSSLGSCAGWPAWRGPQSSVGSARSRWRRFRRRMHVTITGLGTSQS